jgi:hypothetical protein
MERQFVQKRRVFRGRDGGVTHSMVRLAVRLPARAVLLPATPRTLKQSRCREFALGDRRSITKLETSNELGGVYTPVTLGPRMEFRASMAGGTGRRSRRIVYLYPTVL